MPKLIYALRGKSNGVKIGARSEGRQEVLMKRLLITAVTFCGILLGQATTPALATTPTFDVICTGTDSQTFHRVC